MLAASIIHGPRVLERHQAENRDHDTGREQHHGTEAEDGEDVLGEVANDAAGPGGPVHSDEVATKNDALTEAVALDLIAEFDVFKDLQGMAFIAPNAAVDVVADEIEGSDADGLPALGVGDLPRTL